MKFVIYFLLFFSLSFLKSQVCGLFARLFTSTVAMLFEQSIPFQLMERSFFGMTFFSPTSTLDGWTITLHRRETVSGALISFRNRSLELLSHESFWKPRNGDSAICCKIRSGCEICNLPIRNLKSALAINYRRERLPIFPIAHPASKLAKLENCAPGSVSFFLSLSSS